MTLELTYFLLKPNDCYMLIASSIIIKIGTVTKEKAQEEYGGFFKTQTIVFSGVMPLSLLGVYESCMEPSCLPMGNLVAKLLVSNPSSLHIS